ncbi:HAD-IA family hydrolase, partial [Alistipes finegoldii]|uniref:HAD-IA family hydrolase n=1 Tax=Alistipes finegoldii TaxID=214856 RepID=UPI003AB5564C
LRADAPLAAHRQTARRAYHARQLRAAGVRTYVLSNNNPAAMVAIRGAFTADGHTMDDYFDKIYLSYELHELKPSEAIFRKVIADSGVIPAETLFIDDGRKNVDAAQALGFAVYMPAPGEDFGHLFEEITR